MTDNTLQALRKKRAEKIAEWNETKKTMLIPVENEIARYLYTKHQQGVKISQLCKDYGTKDRRTIMNYLRLGERLAPHTARPSQGQVSSWGDVATVTEQEDGRIRVEVHNVPIDLWTQTTVPVEDDYSGWIEYMANRRTVFKASEKISPLHAEPGIHELIALEKM